MVPSYLCVQSPVTGVHAPFLFYVNIIPCIKYSIPAKILLSIKYSIPLVSLFLNHSTCHKCMVSNFLYVWSPVTGVYVPVNSAVSAKY